MGIIDSMMMTWNRHRSTRAAPRIRDLDGKSLYTSCGSGGVRPPERAARCTDGIGGHGYPCGFAPSGFIKRCDRRVENGSRFVLRVTEDDLDAHRWQVLKQTREEDEAGPRTGAVQAVTVERIYPVGKFWRSFLAFWGMGKWPENELNVSPATIAARLKSLQNQ